MEDHHPVPLGIRLIVAFFVLSILLWTIGQGGALISYDSVARFGFQESRESVDPVVVEVNKGIAFADVLIQIPLFVLAAIGLWRLKFWGALASWMALGINVYWTTVAWAKQYFYLHASVKCEPFAIALHCTLAVIFLFSVWASWHLFKNRMLFD